jgi:hypothetical protein
VKIAEVDIQNGANAARMGRDTPPDEAWAVAVTNGTCLCTYFPKVVVLLVRLVCSLLSR